MTTAKSQRSEIRQSTIDSLLKKVSRGNYQHYLRDMQFGKLRAYVDKRISFDFPVTALVGPNGGGKTTVLGAAAIIHSSIKPRQYFAKSGIYDKSMVNWNIEYSIIDNSKSIRRTASYPKSKWNRDAIARPIFTFGVSRTLPATERKDLSAFIAGNFRGSSEADLTPETIRAVEQILGKEASNYILISGASNQPNKLYAARSTVDSYSEFHFGAGEASVIRIVRDIEEAPSGSLIVIEEIENGLHPLATRRLVEYLIEVCQRKSCQVIFTTHSNDALGPLPEEAVWACANGSLTQGKLDVHALRTLTGEIEAQLAIFTEDRFGALMAGAALRSYASRKDIEIQGIQIHAVGGESNVLTITKNHNNNPAIKFKAIGIVDGDMSAKADAAALVTSFPGIAAPESQVAEAVLEKMDSISSRLAINLGLQPADQGRVAEATRQRMKTCRDPHLLFAQIGEDLDYLGEGTVQSAYVAQWSQNCPDEVDAIFDPVRHALPKRGSTLKKSALDTMVP